jgi:hypothetical protein
MKHKFFAIHPNMERDKTTAAVGFDCVAKIFNFSESTLHRGGRGECELLRLRH